mgnify:CR=1 FL=1
MPQHLPEIDSNIYFFYFILFWKYLPHLLLHYYGNENISSILVRAIPFLSGGG